MEVPGLTGSPFLRFWRNEMRLVGGKLCNQKKGKMTDFVQPSPVSENALLQGCFIT